MPHQATTVDEVVVELARVARELPPTDGVKWFALMYSEATNSVAESVRRGEFESPEFMPRLIVRFCNGFLEAVEGTLAPTNAWNPFFDARYDPDVAPLQFAIAGYNSHMGYEMPLGLVAAWRDLGAEPSDDSPERRDYERLNSAAGRVHPRVREFLRNEAVDQVGGRFEGVDDVVGSWSHEDARAAAWAQGVALWRLWDDHAVVVPYLASLDRSVGLVSKLLLVPTAAKP